MGWAGSGHQFLHAGACIWCMAPGPAHEDGGSGGRRRGGRRNLSWGSLLCFCSGSGQEAVLVEGTTAPRSSWRRRRKKRTVPMDGDLVGTAADSSELMRRGTDEDEEERSRKRKGLLLQGCCCFLAPARAPGREVRTENQ